MGFPDPSSPVVFHSCPDCETLRRERDRFTYELVLEGDREAEFMHWWSGNGRLSPCKVTVERTREFSGWSYNMGVGVRSSEAKTTIRSPDKKMLALAKLFLS